MGVLQELEEAVGSVATKAGPSVVGIGGGWGHGSGVVVAEGNVLTNAHNVRGDQVTVVFADGRTATGEVTGTDLDGDLAVVSVDTTGAPAIGWEPAADVSKRGVGVVPSRRRARASESVLHPDAAPRSIRRLDSADEAPAGKRA